MFFTFNYCFIFVTVFYDCFLGDLGCSERRHINKIHYYYYKSGTLSWSHLFTSSMGADNPKTCSACMGQPVCMWHIKGHFQSPGWTWSMFLDWEETGGGSSLYGTFFRSQISFKVRHWSFHCSLLRVFQTNCSCSIFKLLWWSFFHLWSILCCLRDFSNPEHHSVWP